jgi:hypothetical protein
MDNYKLVDKLQNRANISYEEAKNVLEKTNWDILDAFVYLEEMGKIKKPSLSTYYTNESKESYKRGELITVGNQRNNYNYKKKDNTFGGIFEAVCKIIDMCNNIFFQIERENIVFLKIPITVIILLLMFAFWIVIPLSIIGLFFDMEFSITGNWGYTDKVNNIFKMLLVSIKKVKKELKKGFKHG